ncbi:MAG: ABC transporter ATP-binding protein [Anaerolineae bacterium]|nr:ABC transporter ATP-binding protein [Anaerolineae bacterium]
MNDYLITVKNLIKTYGSAEVLLYALAGVDLNIRQGEFVAIMGPSGSGKSTLMNILGCLDRATEGTYILDDEDVSELSKVELADVRNRKIGFVFQSFNLLPRLPAYKNVMLPMMYYRAEDRPEAEEREMRAIKALESVGLGDRLEHHPNQLSGGQQQRVAIARALVNRPPLLLADEPTGNLDSRSSEEIMALIHNLHAQGVTIMMVTHEPDIAAHAERVICLRDGNIVSDGRDGASECERQRGAL